MKSRWPVQTIAERFWSHVDKNGPIHPVLLTPCWLWTAGLGDTGYGKFRVSGDVGPVKAHRFAWKEIGGREIPDGHGVLHRCDVRPCVNYETHLFTGTKKDNTLDMFAKGRGRPYGYAQGVGVNVLSESEIANLIAARTRRTLTQLAGDFGIGLATVSRILRAAGC